MDLMRRTMIGALGAVLVAGPLRAQSGLSGAYAVQGRNPDGSTYTGDVQIAEQGGVFNVVWLVAGRSYSGTGQLDGRVLTVDWGAAAPVVYVAMPDGSLQGTWANGLALERLTRR